METFHIAHISDSSHGWLRVPKSLVIRLNILPDITPYSYEDDSWYYLEEDQDARTFSNAMINAHLKFITTNVNDGDSSPIRNLPRV